MTPRRPLLPTSAPLAPGARSALVWLGMLSIALAFWNSAFARLESTGPYDWQFYIQMWETIRVGIQRFGELALWNPYQCGGVTLWGNPQNPQFSPLFLPALVLGTSLAMKVRLVLLASLGLMGTYVLARRVYSIVELTESARVIFNQTFAPGWRSSTAALWRIPVSPPSTAWPASTASSWNTGPARGPVP